MQKASSHALRRSYTLYAIGFRIYFTPLAGVLFAFPSRYWFTIGCQGVFRLIQWSGQIHAEFHVHRITWDSSRGVLNFADPAVTVSGRSFQSVQLAFHLPFIEVPQPRRDKSLRFSLLPLSLATTYGITFVFFSWGY